MREVIWFLRGYLILKITGASPSWALNRLAGARIPFWRVAWQDSFTVEICVLRRDREKAAAAIESAMCDHQSLREVGARAAFGGLLRRPVLLVMLVLSVASVVVIPKFVLFYTVTGNETVPDQEILRTLQELNVGFGTFGPRIHPQNIKNHMLNLLPQLQWITVTQNGVCAEVVVRERPPKPEIENRKGFSNIVASQSGVITQQSVLAGQALHKVGDVVEKGELLVSGIVDLETVFTVENANAEIYARTWRKNEALIPSEYGEKIYSGASWTCRWLIIGEKRIKIFGNSGISTTACDKMIETRALSLPGGYIFPVSIVTETFRPYTVAAAQMPGATAQLLLEDYTQRTALGQMVAGEILESRSEMTEQNACYRLSAVLECHEMIAATVEADWIKEDIAHD